MNDYELLCIIHCGWRLGGLAQKTMFNNNTTIDLMEIQIYDPTMRDSEGLDEGLQ